MTLVQKFLTGTYRVSRQGPGFYREGFYVPGASQDIEIQGSLQPLSGREIKLVEEGDRLKALFKFYSDAPVLVDDPRRLAGSDRVVIDGETYKVLSIERWLGSLSYFKSVLAREPQQGGRP
jgi:hypothetical protein